MLDFLTIPEIALAACAVRRRYDQPAPYACDDDDEVVAWASEAYENWRALVWKGWEKCFILERDQNVCSVHLPVILDCISHCPPFKVTRGHAFKQTPYYLWRDDEHLPTA